MARARRSSTANPEKVSGEYVSNEGWEVGNVAPSDKFRTQDGKVVDKLPKGEGGWQIAVKGAPVTQALAAELADDSDDDTADDSTE